MLAVRVTLLAGGLLLLAGVLLLARPAAAQTDPPFSGPWEVSDTTYWNEPVTLQGDLVVQASGQLVLEDTEITFACMEKAEFGVRVLGGGRLAATNVTFRSRDAAFPCMFVINTNAAVELRGCTITNVGTFGQSKDTWGIYVHSSSVLFYECEITACNAGVLVQGYFSPVIESCDFHDNSDRGVWCMYSTPEIRNCTFSNNSYGIFLEESPGPLLLNNDFSANRREAVAMDQASFLGDWAVDRPVAWNASTVLLRGNLTVGPGGALALRESAIAVDSGALLRRTVRVLPGGSLSLERSTVSPVPGGGDRSFGFIAEGNLSLEGSAVQGAGFDGSVARQAGLYIASGAKINGSDLSGNLASLVCAGQVTVTNTTLNGSWQDVWMAGGTLRMLNAGFDRDRVLSGTGSGLLEAGWHLSAGAVWQNGRGVPGAWITARDSAQDLLFEGAPGADGWVRWIEVITYRLQDGSAEAREEVSLLARKPGLPDISRTVDLTGNREEALVFRDPSPPSLSVTSPADGAGTNTTTVLLSGTATDDFGLDRVECRLDESLRWIPLESGNWSLNITNLSRGDHRIAVRAVDLAGQTAWANLTVTVDLEPPRLELDEPFDRSVLSRGTSVRFSGRTDPGASVTVGGLPVPVDEAGYFDRTVDLPEGTTEVEVVARDRGGNVAVLTRTVRIDLTPPPITVLSPPNGTRTRLDELCLAGLVEPGARFRVDGSTVELLPDGSFNVTVLLSGGPKTVELYAEDAAGNPNTTTWTMERIIDRPPAPDPLQRYGLALAGGAVVLIVLVALLAAVLMRRRRRRETPPGAVLSEPPPHAGGPRRPRQNHHKPQDR